MLTRNIAGAEAFEYSTTGVKQKNGQVHYKAYDNVSREAMAAFMYRMAGKPAFNPSGRPFADMKPGDKFYKESTWMESTNITTGITQPNGRVHYAPRSKVTREAMAAFIYRYKKTF
ncbi:hypothetical protein ACXR2T_05965 [Leucobacter sp. HY1910]